MTVIVDVLQAEETDSEGWTAHDYAKNKNHDTVEKILRPKPVVAPVDVAKVVTCTVLLSSL